MKMKHIILMISILIFSQIYVSAQSLTDTISDQQKQEILNRVLIEMMMKARGGDQEMESQELDSVPDEVGRKYKPGAPAYAFCFQDIRGNPVALEDLRGKYVYIDVWATWCPPCLKELPYLQALEEKMANKKIVFVSISLDEKKARWGKMVREKKLGGIQLHYGGDENFTKEYGITGIPRFLLLDKKGQVVNIYMTRPSKPATERILMNLKGI